MKYFKDNFDDNCYELTILRWFRDSFVLEDDIKYYYKIAPIIIETINNLEEKDIIYNNIYYDVIHYCVKQIECGNYELAYDRYKNSVLLLEERLVRPNLEQRLVKALKLRRIYVKNK